MSGTKWWKCDLQVATPAWEFKLPAGSNFKFDVAQERYRFLDDYMTAVRAAGIDVIGLADHNTGAWIDEVKMAGQRHGVIVFPGCEITTHTGADGVHLIVLGDPQATSQDFDRLIYGCLGFGHGSPTFLDQNGSRIPGTSSKTLIQILDELPDGFLAIAPHVLNDNGVASAKTVKGDMRWKALHHERLVAIDPGDCSDTTGEGFNAKLRRRDLNDFPRLREMAFIATSDAYSLDALGSRFTWLRMGEMSIEGLRQAFLDHESRVLCDSSTALASMPDKNPNNVRHAWISSVSLEGQLTNSTASLEIPFHPNLNVIIGGRGSGKSSVVAALRQLYSSTESLPKRLREDADFFVETVFSAATLKSSHRVQESQEEHQAQWSRSTGSTTLIGGENVPSSFSVTVISQKELFERAAGDKNDPYLSSRSLLSLVDGSIKYSSSDVRSIDSFGRQLDDARVVWSSAVRNHVLLESDLAQLPGLRQQAATLQGQVDAFSSPEVQSRLARINARRQEEESLLNKKKRLLRLIGEAQLLKSELLATEPTTEQAGEPFTEEFAVLNLKISELTHSLAELFSKAVIQTEEALNKFEIELNESQWHKDVVSAAADFDAYRSDLQNKGLSTSEFGRLQDELTKTRETIRRLEEKEPQLASTLQETTEAWMKISGLMERRRSARQTLLEEVQQRSGRLRFKTKRLADIAPWVEQLRAMAGFRADAFLEDTPALAVWLWETGTENPEQRWLEWRTAMATGAMTDIQRKAKLRQTFSERLASLDETIRLRLASLVPDDVVMMEFLRENGNPGNDGHWQSVTQGSPGQRTAAMLAFVLHHGREPLILDQPEDDLDSEWISKLVVKELRQSRWHRQLIVVSHNANIPVLGDAEQVIALENKNGALVVKTTEVAIPDGAVHRVIHVGPVENQYVRNDIQAIMEGGVAAFVRREQKYNNETRLFKSLPD
ncbi:TrlF family AAA-like ATPase [Polaromonas sp. YR568]|uniref:TrlF family AAA-like ATPase n=1 Tax=Polaromonas sp. YR568 TaxID=1855301 RepID=UPI00398BE0F2